MQKGIIRGTSDKGIKKSSSSSSDEKGIIPGTADFINEYMLSLTSSIKEDLRKHFSSDQKEYYIYTRFDHKKRIFKIFVRLNAKTTINKRPYFIYFLVTINEKFPEAPPVVNCLTNFTYPSLYDSRDFLSCLHPDWKSNSSLVSLIKKLPKFVDFYENDINNSILHLYGGYSSDIYSINDFVANKGNVMKRIEIITHDPQSHNKEYLEKRYLVITDLYLILLYLTSPSDLTRCKIVFYGELRDIEEIQRILPKDPETYKEKAILRIAWKQTALKTYSNDLVTQQLEYEVIKEEIIKRRGKIEETFKLYTHDKESDVEQLNKIIEVKEKFLEESGGDSYTCKIILDLYQRIIEIYSGMNDDRYMPYVKKTQELLKNYNDDESEK